MIAAAALFGAKAVGLPEDPREWPQDLKDCIEGVKLTREGPEVVLSDRNTAARLHSQLQGEITDKHEHAGAGGAPLLPPGGLTISFEDGAPGVPPAGSEGGTD